MPCYTHALAAAAVKPSSTGPMRNAMDQIAYTLRVLPKKLFRLCIHTHTPTRTHTDAALFKCQLFIVLKQFNVSEFQLLT